MIPQLFGLLIPLRDNCDSHVAKSIFKTLKKFKLVYFKEFSFTVASQYFGVLDDVPMTLIENYSTQLKSNI